MQIYVNLIVLSSLRTENCGWHTLRGQRIFVEIIFNEWILEQILSIIPKLVDGKDVLFYIGFLFWVQFLENKMCNANFVCLILLYPCWQTRRCVYLWTHYPRKNRPPLQSQKNQYWLVLANHGGLIYTLVHSEWHMPGHERQLGPTGLILLGASEKSLFH